MDLYKPLPASRTIRVLSLTRLAATTSETGTCTQPVCCDMSVIPLTEPFDALSYVWGDPSVNGGSMICNGHQIDITYNLWAALSQIWKIWPERKLWVDAICINQNDIPERNQQVTMMGAIYSTAQCVVVWLGESTEKSNQLFELLESIQNKPDSSENTMKNMDEEPFYEILSRPWFERVWTLQEIQLAKKAIVCCGSQHSDFQTFLQGVQTYNKERSKDDPTCGTGQLHVPILPTSNEDLTLFPQLAQTMDRKATDPRDKFYSLLSLLPKELYDFIEVDYSLTIEEVIIWASRICIELDQESGCLVDAGLENQRDKSLPSWALDWRVPHDYDYQNSYRKLEYLKKDSEQLRLRHDSGRKLDRVNRKLGIRGGGLGRLEINDANQTAHLALFPECAFRRPCFLKPLPVPTWVEMSSIRFLAFCKKVKQHDEKECKCLKKKSLAWNINGVTCQSVRRVATGSGRGLIGSIHTTLFCTLLKQMRKLAFSWLEKRGAMEFVVSLHVCVSLKDILR